ncbi:MAG TPA: hypothetical protein VKB26_14850 [Candidatus Acidoferrales bacterium]|nr:hypothetical protein [Candidatus Acidoferrales bacterium]
MTVAIAAVCKMQGGTAVIAAEDHMITAGDVEFEQPQPKMWRQGPHAVALMYGDAAAQAEIANASELEVIQRHIVDVSEIAKVLYRSLRSYVRRLAESDVLGPLGLTTDSFLNHQSFGSQIYSEIIRQLQDYYRKSGLHYGFGGAILIGADGIGTQGHVYKIEYAQRVWVDRIGFAAAGAGQWHAESQFMFSRYTTEWDFPEALSLLYTAKKRAEVAPGVGAETDIVVITTNPRNVIHFDMTSPLVAKLEEIYQAGKQRHDEATAWQHQEVRKYIEPFLSQNPIPSAPAGGAPGASPTPAAAEPSTSKKPKPENSSGG